MAENITLKQGEARKIKFTIVDANDNVVNCASTVCSLVIKYKKGDNTKIIEKTDSDFDKTDALTGLLYVTLTSDDTDIESNVYLAELKIIFTANSIEKSHDIDFIVEEAL